MTIKEEQIMGCPDCGHRQTAEFYQSISVKEDPGLKEKLLSGMLNIFVCEECGKKSMIDLVFLYHDMDKRFCVQYCPYDHVLQQNKILSDMYTVEGKLRIPENIQLPEITRYMYEPHIVLSLDEMIRYVRFRDMLFDKMAVGEVMH